MQRLTKERAKYESQPQCALYLFCFNEILFRFC